MEFLKVDDGPSKNRFISIRSFDLVKRKLFLPKQLPFT